MSKKVTALYRKIEKYREHREAPELQRELEYNRRRKLRKQRSKLIHSDRKLYLYKKIYSVAGLTFLLGIVVTFGSTVQSLGEGSFLWNKRHLFSIMGPVLLGLGVLTTLVGSALVFQRKDRVIEEKGLSRQSSSFNSFTRQNSTSKRSLSREVSVDSSSTDYRVHRQQKLVGLPGRSADDSDVEAFLQSSTSSSSTSYTIGGTLFSVNWTTPLKNPTDRERPPLLRQQAVHYPEKETSEQLSGRNCVHSKSSTVETIDEIDGSEQTQERNPAGDSTFDSKDTHNILVLGVRSHKLNVADTNIRKMSYQKATELPITMSTNGNTKLVEMCV